MRRRCSTAPLSFLFSDLGFDLLQLIRSLTCNSQPKDF
jgi:hypothetical protein